MNLAVMTYYPGGDFVLQRPRIQTFAVAWFNPMYLTTPGNPSRYQLAGFGGVRLHLKWFDWVYAFDGRAMRMDGMIEDLWAEAVSDPTPIGGFDVAMHWGYNTLFQAQDITLIVTSTDEQRVFQAFPEAPFDYYNPPRPLTYEFPITTPP